MKRSLLIARCILLVIAAPTVRKEPSPPPHSIANLFRIGTVSDSVTHGGETPQANCYDHQLDAPPTDQTISNHTTYLFGRTRDNQEVIDGIGKPQEMKNVAPKPKFENLDTDKLAHIVTELSEGDAEGTSKSWMIIRSVMDDRNTILESTKYIQSGKTPLKALGNILKAPALPNLFPDPERLSPQEYREHLIGVLSRRHNELRDVIYKRNSAFRDLIKLNIPPRINGYPDPINVYVAYWMNTHPRLPTTPVYATHLGAEDVQRSTTKRPLDEFKFNILPSPKRHTNPSGEPVAAQYTRHGNPSIHTTSAQILHGIGALPPSHNIISNPSSQNFYSTPSDVQGHSIPRIKNAHEFRLPYDPVHDLGK
ncbi:hypothetical protein H0H93_007162 [Arthromyces matolae]|nr:hypothetical protein H0H93_007162 [Arthromyces matolae]